MLLIGKCLGVETAERNGQNGPYLQKTAHILDGMRTHAVKLSANFATSDVPAKDEDVALEVFVSAYSGRNGVQTSTTATGRDRAAESKLFTKAGPAPVRNAS